MGRTTAKRLCGAEFVGRVCHAETKALIAVAFTTLLKRLRPSFREFFPQLVKPRRQASGGHWSWLCDGLAHYCSERCHFFRTALRWRRGSESNRRIKVLQTSPLPLGYRAILNIVPPGSMEPQPGICDFPITPARLTCKNRDFHHAACAATTFRLNPSGNPATSGRLGR
jgi:hypothetical protein